MSITPEHMRASYDRYINHGNSSSATVISVMNRLREKDMDELAPGGRVRDYVVGCAFGPGIASEMCVLKRNMGHVRRVVGGEVTPPLSDGEPSEGNRSDTEGEPEPRAVRETEELKKETQADFGKASLDEALNGVELD